MMTGLYDEMKIADVQNITFSKYKRICMFAFLWHNEISVLNQNSKNSST